MHGHMHLLISSTSYVSINTSFPICWPICARRCCRFRFFVNTKRFSLPSNISSERCMKNCDFHFTFPVIVHVYIDITMDKSKPTIQTVQTATVTCMYQWCDWYKILNNILSDFELSCDMYRLWNIGKITCVVPRSNSNEHNLQILDNQY